MLFKIPCEVLLYGILNYVYGILHVDCALFEIILDAEKKHVFP